MENTNKIVLFAAEQKNANSPKMTGNAEVNGIKYRAAAWINLAKSGQEYMAIYLNPVIEMKQEPEENKSTILTDDDLPF